MKIVAPDYYGEFECIKGACRHSCCAGWEIDIDPESRERYRKMTGILGGKLAENIVDSPDGAHFRLGAGERCPFLQADGLCEMIIALGEESLCQICADHPRFRNFFSESTELGLGLCCEAAGRLMLSWKAPVSFIALEDDGDCGDAYEDESELREIRGELIKLAQDRSMSVEGRVERICDAMDSALPEIDYARWAEFLKGLERMDDSWADRLAALQKAGDAAFEGWETEFEQLLVYLIWRHLPGALDDGDVEGRAAFCALMWRIMRRMFAVSGGGFEELVEIARLYSSEIEYSDENIGEILAELHRNGV